MRVDDLVRSTGGEQARPNGTVVGAVALLSSRVEHEYGYRIVEAADQCLDTSASRWFVIAATSIRSTDTERGDRKFEDLPEHSPTLSVALRGEGVLDRHAASLSRGCDGVLRSPAGRDRPSSIAPR